MIHRPLARTDRKPARNRRAAFTLLEVLVVVAIIVMLAGAGGYFVLQQYESAKVSRAKIDVRALSEYVQTYYAKHDQFPPSLEALTQPQEDGTGALFPPEKLFDPWGKPYQYNPEGPNNGGNRADVWTTTPKGIPVGNWGR